MSRDFKTGIKTLIVVETIAIVLAVGGILLLRSTTPEPIVQTPPSASYEMRIWI